MPPEVTLRFPAPPMLAAAESVALPFRLRVEPAAGVKLPVLSATVSARLPALTCTKPELAQGTVKAAVPEPIVFLTVPAFRNNGVPPLTPNTLPSPSRSSVPLRVLLKMAVMQVICPFVHVAGPLFTSVPPANILPGTLPLIARPPFANRIKLEPGLPNVPPVHENMPETAIGILPWRVPAERFNKEGARFPLPLKKTIPPFMTRGVLLMMHVPSSLTVPPLKVFVPVMLRVP